MNIIYSKQTIYEITKAFPDLILILVELGFKEITKPGMIASVGRFMTLKQGCSLRKIDYEFVKDELNKKGYTLKDDNHE